MRATLASLSLLVLTACGGTSSPTTPADAGADVVADAPEVLPTAAVTPTGSLKEARANHTATLLQDGRVLVVGGEQIATRTPTASIEVWDPKTGQFTKLADLPSPIVGHSATLLADGRVLIAGSGNYTENGVPSGEAVSDAAYLFDPKTNAATPTGSMKHKRSHHFAVALGDGKVLVGGGADAVPGPIAPALASVEIFDPQTGQFTDEATMIEAREQAQALALDGDRVLVVSGINTKKGSLGSTEIYDRKTHAFAAGPPLADGGRIYHSMLRTSDGSVYVLGGVQSSGNGAVFLDSVEVLHGSTFDIGPLVPKGRNSAPLVEVKGHPVAFGGYAYEIGLSAFFDDVLYLDGAGWHRLAGLEYGRFGHTATKLADGRVIVIGGSNAKTLNRAEIVSFE